MARQLHGTNYIPQDLEAKFTGRARYAEDFRADGMLFAKLLLSPMPHARIVNIDTSAAIVLRSPSMMVTSAMTPVSTIPRRGLFVGPWPVPKKVSSGNSRSFAKAWRMRGAPSSDASADDRVAERTPASMSHGSTAIRFMLS